MVEIHSSKRKPKESAPVLLAHTQDDGNILVKCITGVHNFKGCSKEVYLRGRRLFVGQNLNFYGMSKREEIRNRKKNSNGNDNREY